MTAIPATD